MARSSALHLLTTASVLVLTGAVAPVLAQVVVPPPPAGVPPPITVLSVNPGDPGDPGNPPGSPGGPGGPTSSSNPTSTPAPTDPKDMKDMKDMKQTVSYTALGSDAFEVFVSGSGTHGDMGSTADPGHFYFDRAQGNLGLEYHFAQDWTVGTILSYAHVDSSYGEINASTTADSYLPTLFVAYSHDGWFANLSTTEGYDTFTEDRGTPNGTAHGADDGFQYGGKLIGGYLFKSGAWSYGPLLDFHGYHLNASGFTEDGAGVSDLHFNRTNTETLQSQVGGLVRFDTEVCGVQVEPYFSASWQHEYADANEQITGSNSVGVGFSGNSVYLDRDAALLDLGVRAKISNSVDLYLGYEGAVGGNWLTNTAEGGVNISF